ncbi:uncharacterized protein LOC118425289 [Branchiostoma floridae]|uniref:Uncharacterized protein LOC118425289 n=1 Tax=Branchiostoma floridae TaxID=7739 RepID=A0A9J7N1Y2_BRAFL|nr:uncharacterized protein LOC118425289 [Branchiostoma floridae]
MRQKKPLEYEEWPSKGTTPMQQTDWQARADATACFPNPMYASGADRTYSGGPSGCRALCSFIRSKLAYVATGIAVLLILVCVGLSLLAFINNEEISELTTTLGAFKNYQDNMSTIVDAMKPDQDFMNQLFTTVDALKHHDDDDMRRLSTIVDTLKRDQDDMPQLTTTVDALKHDQDDLRQLTTNVDALKRDLAKELIRTGPTMEQSVDETSETSVFVL